MDRDDRPASGEPSAVPPGLPPAPKVSMGSALSVIFTRPSAWLAAGVLGLLILEVCFLKSGLIPEPQLPIFKDIVTATTLLLSTMVHSVFHGDAK